MNWIKVTIYTTNAGIEPVSGRLLQLGITGLEIEDAKEFDDFLEESKEFWDYVDEDLVTKMHGETNVKVYVSDDTAGRELLLAIKSTLAELKSLDIDNVFGRLEMETDGMTEEDWTNNWRKYFHTMEIGERLLIKPEWEELEKPTDRIVFNIEPGMSFGTGSHYTTQLCLEALEKYIKPGDKMLDLGCGSGILSVIALMLGASEAVAVDIDPNAVDTAYQNAARNNVDKSKYTVLAGNVVTDSDIQAEISRNKYEVVCANIVADVIIGLAPKAREYMKEGGVFITSGIIEDRIDDVKAALLDNGFEIVAVNKRKDWASIICR
ncbi:MAG: 50S ribosomal protein L11 methyltransferase [Clostridia bacterium]|nr:50S ribosomal protein L11 methyltransferase [Clostridia bacterium]MBQ3471998.1 50S ribosomal protein L11 methyltransferase [Clostridia bacterium]MBQ6530583.1 50S ribosomal protein L11 methyltransferase [Clostridia bacterium]